ncbi:MAG: RHS domain-containing protein [Gammaproteobacteria bacterium]|nr:RHS domain-containing protein [Gammaproteobacteria bacterium]
MRIATIAEVAAAEVILDEEQAVLSGNWMAVNKSRAYQGDAQSVTKLNRKGRNASSATWSSDLSGTYAVYAHWYKRRRHATNAPYTITHANGSDTVTVDQTVNGGSWQLLGTYDFAGSGSVELSNAANGKVIADAIRFVPVGSSYDTYYVHTNHLDAPIALSDQDGVVQWQGSYDPYGNLSTEIDNVSQKLRFPGQYADAETGMHYNYFRDYDSEIGRYLQSDPIGLNGGINTFGYVGGNPVNAFDVFGLLRMDDPYYGHPQWVQDALHQQDPYGSFGVADLPSFPQWFVNRAAGFGDSIWFNTTKHARDYFDMGSVNVCSRNYIYGGYIGDAVGYLNGGKAGFSTYKQYKRAKKWRQNSKTSRRTRNKKIKNAKFKAREVAGDIIIDEIGDDAVDDYMSIANNDYTDECSCESQE